MCIILYNYFLYRDIILRNYFYSYYFIYYFKGICDYTSGKCNCFDGYFGNDCHIMDPELVYSDFTTGDEL